MGEQRIERPVRVSAPPRPVDSRRPFASPAGGGFESILFDRDAGDVASALEPPFFSDLNLDQVVSSITAGRDEYDLTQFFYAPLRSVVAVEYRHEVCRDLERDGVRAAVRLFAERMQRMRRLLGLAKKQHYKYEKERWFLDAAAIYCDAVSSLARALAELDLSSPGFQGLRDHVTGYTASERFKALAAEAQSVLEGLGRVKYTVRIRGRRVAVSSYSGERDYSLEVERTFERFRQGEVEDHRFKLQDSGSMDHVEARIAELVARLYPDAFRALDAFCTRHRDFLDRAIARFDREVQFYLAYADYTDKLVGGAGLSFCYPTVSVSFPATMRRWLMGGRCARSGGLSRPFAPTWSAPPG